MKSRFSIFLFIIFIVSVVIAGWFLNPSGMVHTLSPVVFREECMLKRGVMLDVRKKNEFEKSHIPGAFNIDMLQPGFREETDSLLDKKIPYFIYSENGHRGDKAMRILQVSGFNDLYNMRGGYNEWQREGLPIVSSIGDTMKVKS